MTAATLSLPPSATRFERVLQAVLAAGLAGLGLFLPFSTAGTSICLALLLLVGAFMAARLWRAAPWREPLFVAGLLLLAYIALRTLAEVGLHAEALTVVNHYHELLMIPILWTLMRAGRRRDAFVFGLLVGATGLALAHWLPLPPCGSTRWRCGASPPGSACRCAPSCFFEEARLRTPAALARLRCGRLLCGDRRVRSRGSHRLRRARLAGGLRRLAQRARQVALGSTGRDAGGRLAVDRAAVFDARAARRHRGVQPHPNRAAAQRHRGRARPLGRRRRLARLRSRLRGRRPAQRCPATGTLGPHRERRTTNT